MYKKWIKEWNNNNKKECMAKDLKDAWSAVVNDR